MSVKLTLPRALLCVFGNFILGLGVALTNIASLGIDPFNGMCMSVSHVLHVPYAPFTLCVNVLFFVFELLWGRKYIFFGTFVNWFLFSYFVTFFLWLCRTFGFSEPQSLVMRIFVLLVGLMLMGLGLAMYQEASLGISPYDCMPLIIRDRHPRVPFFAGRVAMDALMLLGILLVGNPLHKIGIGTVLTAFGLGPVISLFTTLMVGKKRRPSAAKPNS